MPIGLIVGAYLRAGEAGRPNSGIVVRIAGVITTEDETILALEATGPEMSLAWLWPYPRLL